jgi:hypothetical protein
MTYPISGTALDLLANVTLNEVKLTVTASSSTYANIDIPAGVQENPLPMLTFNFQTAPPYQIFHYVIRAGEKSMCHI